MSLCRYVRYLVRPLISLSFFLFLRLMSAIFSLFFFNDTATTEIYTLSLHDALPICFHLLLRSFPGNLVNSRSFSPLVFCQDRKSTRLNSSHQIISYAVFCLKKKTKKLFD